MQSSQTNVGQSSRFLIGGHLPSRIPVNMCSRFIDVHLNKKAAPAAAATVTEAATMMATTTTTKK